MDQQPFFSVVIPLYNKKSSIERAVRSVWEQTYEDYELIVVDDGSTDGSDVVVNRLLLERDFRVIHKANSGVSDTRNLGAREAKGRFIALLDADDFWRPKHLSDLYIAHNTYPSLGILGTGYERQAGAYRYFTIPWPGVRNVSLIRSYRYGEPIHTSSIAIDRALWIESGGFDNHFTIYEDHEFFFRLGLRSKLALIPRASVVYTDDASERLTTRLSEWKAIDRPHFMFIERLLVEGAPCQDVVRYARVVGHLISGLSFSRGSRGYQEFLKAFPKISKFGFKNVFAAKAWLKYYKVRNHLIIWKSRLAERR